MVLYFILRTNIRIISDSAKEKGEKEEKSEAENLVVSATIAIFVVENRENGLRIGSQNKLDGSRLAQSKI